MDSCYWCGLLDFNDKFKLINDHIVCKDCEECYENEDLIKQLGEELGE